MLTIIKLKILKLKDDYRIFLLMSALNLLLIYFMGGTSSEMNMTMAVIDHSNDIYSKQLIEELNKSSLVDIEITDIEKGIREVREEKYQAALIINKNSGIDGKTIAKKFNTSVAMITGDAYGSVRQLDCDRIFKIPMERDYSGKI